MGSGEKPLHIAFFPLMSPGHMIPMVDMSLLFVQRGVRGTIITTPANASNIRPTVDRAAAAGHHLDLHVIPFPRPEVTGLEPGQENLSAVPAAHLNTFVTALFHFHAPLDVLLRDLRPDCIVSDSLFPWTADLAADLGIPRLVFHGAGAFPMFVLGNIFHYLPLDKESFTMTGLPHEFTLYKDGLPELCENVHLLPLLAAAEAKSYGAVVNTFHEMEPTYVDFLKSKKRAWCVGPVSLFNRAAEDRATRGETPASDRILSWLDTQQPASVVYLCFGSLCRFSGAQLGEIAAGLEASGRPFLWVVRLESAEDEEEWLLPEGFVERTAPAGRGVVVRGWCPQLLVLGHRAVGWFVTHCGWNSLQEAVCAGVPVVTWPLFHEQFINQELLVEVMGVGVRMWEGFRRNRLVGKNSVLVKAEEIAAVLATVGGGGGGGREEMRRRAAEYGRAARKSVEEGGSTYNDVTALLEDLETLRRQTSVDDE